MKENIIGTIKQEAAVCRKRFEEVAIGSPVRCCHHERLIEILEEPAENRIQYILKSKSRDEQARRLHEFLPIPKSMYDDYDAKRKPLEQPIIDLISDTTWNGKSILG